MSHDLTETYTLIHAFLVKRSHSKAARALKKAVNDTVVLNDKVDLQRPQLDEIIEFWRKSREENSAKPLDAKKKRRQSSTSESSDSSDSDSESSGDHRSLKPKAQPVNGKGSALTSSSESGDDPSAELVKKPGKKSTKISVARSSDSESESSESEDQKPSIAETKKNIKKNTKRQAEAGSDSTSSSSSNAKTKANPEVSAPGSRPKAKVGKPKKVETSSSEEESQSGSDRESKGKYSIVPEPGKKGAAKAKQKSDESSSDEADSGEDRDLPPRTSNAPPRPSADKHSSAKIGKAKVAPKKQVQAPTHDATEINAAKKRRTTGSGDAIVTATTHTSKAPPPTQRSNERFKRIDPEKYDAHVVGDNEYRAKGNDYGVRAHQDLSVTRGAGFRKEKNKKKRGSYRGGEITLQSHSFKFTD